MTYYEIFLQGPAVYIPILLIMLGITVLGYGTVPILIALTRKKSITKKKYYLLCYGINFIVMCLFIAFNGKSSGVPYILWTGIFTSIGLSTLKRRRILGEYRSVSHSALNSIEATTDNYAVNNKICFCRKCGSKLCENANFCNKCGTEVISEENSGE